MLNESELNALNPKKLDFPKNCILMHEKEFLKCQNSEKIKFNVMNYQLEYIEQECSIELLEKFLTDEMAFKHFTKCLSESVDSRLYIGGISKDTHYVGIFGMPPSSMIKSLNKLIQDGLIENNASIQKRINEYISLLNESSFQKNFGNQDLKFTIDKQEIIINSSELIKLLVDTNYYDNFFAIEKIGKTYKNLPKEYYAYALMEFIKNQDIFNRYLFSDKVIENIRSLYSMEIIDFQSLNNITETDDENIEKVVVNKELEHYLIKNMPRYLSIFEKAIYIYIKLCKALSYDPEFFAVGQKGDLARKHEDITRLNQITIDNNYAVCYEFNAIYGKMISKLGINFQTISPFIGNFGGGHVYLKFRCEKFLVDADSAYQILNGDLTKAKLNQPISGLTCSNRNKNTKAVFNQVINKMYNLIKEQEEMDIIEKMLDEDENSLSFEKLVSGYKALKNKRYTVLSLDKKFSIMIERMEKANFKEMDAISYLLQLKRMIFSEEERLYHLSMTIIKENIVSERFAAIPTVIFVLNQNNINVTDQNTYFSYNQIDGLKKVTKDYIKTLFEIGKYEYIKSKDCTIPGIETAGDIEIDRRI
jgi:hypothetical protein